jgi:hypothetical protein
MRIRRLTLSIVMLAVISLNLSWGHSLGQGKGKRIKVEKTWDGEIKAELLQQAPPNGFIVYEEAWAKLWEAYRGNKLLLPKIDFDKQMILVGFTGYPNRIGYMPDWLILDEEGDLAVSFVHTLVGYENPPTYRYIFLLISREGVKSINGNPILED